MLKFRTTKHVPRNHFLSAQECTQYGWIEYWIIQNIKFGMTSRPKVCTLSISYFLLKAECSTVTWSMWKQFGRADQKVHSGKKAAKRKVSVYSKCVPAQRAATFAKKRDDIDHSHFTLAPQICSRLIFLRKKGRKHVHNCNELNDSFGLNAGTVERKSQTEKNIVSETQTDLYRIPR